MEKIRNKIKSYILGRFFLAILSIIYEFGFHLKKTVYTFNILKPKFFLKPVICVGNISTGGTGKTTFVITLSKKLAKYKIKNCIVMRGYKSGYSSNEIIDTKTIDNLLEDEKISDEQKVISLSLKDLEIPIIACKDRLKSINYSISKYNPNLIIMDDGFQNFSIHKDINIVIININMLYDKILPLGNLRESYMGVERADFVVLNHCELFDEEYIEKAYSFIKKHIDQNKIVKAKYKIAGFLNNITGIKIGISEFKENFEEVSLFSGIGDNLQFKKMIEKSGFTVSKCWQFPDHHKYSYLELKSINDLRSELPLLTTYKDSVKFMSISKDIFSKDIYSVDVEMELSNNSILNKILKLIK